MRYSLIHIISALILPTALLAQGPLRQDTLKSDTIYRAADVVVEARGILDRQAAATRPLSIISRAQIEASGARDLADAVSYAPGVFVKQYGGIGGLRSVSLRGTSMQQTVVLIDGVRYHNSAGGGLDLGVMPADAIERVEVVRGGDAAMYGANALGGVINIITRTPAAGTRGSAALRLGSFGEQEGTVRAAGRAGAHGWDLMLEGREARGDYPFLFNEYGNETLVRRQNADLQSLYGRGGWSYSSDNGTRIGLMAQGFSSKRGSPGAIVQGSHEQLNARLEEDEIFTVAQGEGRIREWIWNISASGRFNALRYSDPDARLNGPAGLDNRYERREGSSGLKLRRLVGESGMIEGSGEISYGELAGDNLDPSAGGIVRRTGVSGALLSNWFLEELLPGVEITLDGGLRYDWFSDLESGISPSLGFSVHPAGIQLGLRAHVATAFRAPSFSEQYYLNFGNTDLRPERSRCLDLGLTWQPMPTLLLETTLFYIDTRDQIIAIPRSPVTWSAMNVARTITRGGEISLSGDLLDGLFSLRASYTRLRAEDRSGGSVDGRLLVYTPEELLNGIVEIRPGRYRAGVNWQYVSHRHTLPLNPAESSLPHYTLFGLSAGGGWGVDGYSIVLRAEIANLLDVRYQVIRNYPMPGRSFRVGVEVGVE